MLPALVLLLVLASAAHCREGRFARDPHVHSRHLLQTPSVGEYNSYREDRQQQEDPDNDPWTSQPAPPDIGGHAGPGTGKIYCGTVKPTEERIAEIEASLQWYLDGGSGGGNDVAGADQGGGEEDTADLPGADDNNPGGAYYRLPDPATGGGDGSAGDGNGGGNPGPGGGGDGGGNPGPGGGGGGGGGSNGGGGGNSGPGGGGNVPCNRLNNCPPRNPNRGYSAGDNEGLKVQTYSVVGSSSSSSSSSGGADPKAAATRGGVVQTKSSPSFQWDAYNPLRIPVWFHVIRYMDNKVWINNVAQSRITQQISALNSAFSGTGFSFNLAGTTRTLNSPNRKNWYMSPPNGIPSNQGGCGCEEDDMKFNNRKGNGWTLNVYCTSGGGYMGWATFPDWYERYPYFDGIVINCDTLPGGAGPYGLGDALVHEVGHWLGLYHTFQGGCSNPNDHVDDTPASASPTWGCVSPNTRDSCTPDQLWPGRDPVENYMDFTDDACMYKFSAGQLERMKAAFMTYRYPNDGEWADLYWGRRRRRQA